MNLPAEDTQRHAYRDRMQTIPRPTLKSAVTTRWSRPIRIERGFPAYLVNVQNDLPVERKPVRPLLLRRTGGCGQRLTARARCRGRRYEHPEGRSPVYLDNDDALAGEVRMTVPARPCLLAMRDYRHHLCPLAFDLRGQQAAGPGASSPDSFTLAWRNACGHRLRQPRRLSPPRSTAPSPMSAAEAAATVFASASSPARDAYPGRPRVARRSTLSNRIATVLNAFTTRARSFSRTEERSART